MYDLEWLDGDDLIGKCLFRCPECGHKFVATGSMFMTPKWKHGTLRGEPFLMEESLNAKAKREARP